MDYQHVVSQPTFAPPLPLSATVSATAAIPHQLSSSSSTSHRRPSSSQIRRARHARRARPSATGAEQAIPNSPGLLVQSWTRSRSIAATVDLSRRFISVLFISNRCQRAAFAEKQLAQLAEDYAVSRRLLILSAGLDSIPGDKLPLRLVSAARDRDLDLSDERPCAAFEITDLDYYDFVVAVDRNTRDRIMRMAEVFAHTSGGHLYEWERKIRLLCDFTRSITDHHPPSSIPLDVPKMDSSAYLSDSMDVMRNGCEDIIRSLVSAGM